MKNAIQRSTESLQVMGNSKFIMDRANVRCHIENLVILPTMNRILEVKVKFSEISFSCIYRNFANKLFKKALSMQEDLLSKQEFKKGVSLPESVQYLYAMSDCKTLLALCIQFIWMSKFY